MHSYLAAGRSRILFVVVTIFVTAVASAVIAGEDKSAPFTGILKFDRYHVDYEVNPDGTFTVTRDVVVEVLNEQGVKSANHTGFSYSESLEEPEILAAYTLKKDGRRIDVPPSNIQEREAVARGGPMFSDIKAKAIVFPDLAVGDRVGYSYRVVAKTALYPGHFSMTEVFAGFILHDDARISVSVPIDSLDLKVLATGVQGGRIEDKDGRAQWVWTHENHKIAIPELGSVDPIDYAPQIVVSSFGDYGAIAAAYEERAKPKAAVTDKIRSLAAELTAGVSDPREKAKVLYAWVGKNIHFAGNYMGVGSVVPHDAEMVLANRLGDCKGHSTLFQALLAAVDIESTSVMINAGSSFKLPRVASLRALNHVITYIPSLDLYADTSSEFTPFGQLPPTEYGKPAIHTGSFAGLRQTPLIDFKEQTSTMKMVLHIQEDGSAEGETNLTETGITAIVVRAAMAALQPNMEDLFIRHILQKNGLTGTGALTKADPHELAEGYSYGFKYRIDNAVNLPGPGANHIGPIFSSAHPISSVLVGLNLPERTLDFGCLGDMSTEEYTLHFPKNVTISSVPKDVHLTGSSWSYDATYRRDGNIVTVLRKYEDWTKGPTCTPEYDNAFRPIAQGILKDLKAQILFEPAADKQ